MNGWYGIWGREPGEPAAILLMKFPKAVTSRYEAEEALEELRRAGDTELEIKETDE